MKQSGIPCVSIDMSGSIGVPSVASDWADVPMPKLQLRRYEAMETKVEVQLST
jgi:hypothetical protein